MNFKKNDRQMGLLEKVYSGRRAVLKRQILQSALDCFMLYGIEATTIEMIRDRAEASVGAIYHHFKHKEGIITALYMTALNDQAQQRILTLQQAKNIQQGVQAIIYSYIDWVEENPEFARFLYSARLYVKDNTELQSSNQQRNFQMSQWLKQQSDWQFIENIPAELLLSLVVGATESYCRAWLSGRVQTQPQVYAGAFYKAAWVSIEQFDA